MLKVAIVEDEDYVRIGLKTIITEAGRNYDVIGCFTDGEEALKKLLNIKVDAVITDIRMPEMDGLTFIKSLQELETDIAFIILSGYNDFEYARTALKLGVQDFLLKPVDKKELFNSLDCVYKRKYGTESVYTIEKANPKMVIEKVKRIVEDEYWKELSLSEISNRVYLHPKYISYFFKNETGISITDYLIHIRIEKAKFLLSNNTELKVYEIAEKIGYADSVFFNKLFKRVVGVTPKEYRDQSVVM